MDRCADLSVDPDHVEAYGSGQSDVTVTPHTAQPNSSQPRGSSADFEAQEETGSVTIDCSDDSDSIPEYTLSDINNPASSWSESYFSRMLPFVGLEPEPQLSPPTPDLEPNDSSSQRGCEDTSGSLENSSNSTYHFGYPCMFSRVNRCPWISPNRDDWIGHIVDVHMGGKFPLHLVCSFCLLDFVAQRIWPEQMYDPDNRNWRKNEEKNPETCMAYLNHIADHFDEPGGADDNDWVLDYETIKGLLRTRRITESERNDLAEKYRLFLDYRVEYSGLTVASQEEYLGYPQDVDAQQGHGESSRGHHQGSTKDKQAKDKKTKDKAKDKAKDKSKKSKR